MATPDAVTIKWRTDSATDSVVLYGPAPDALTFSASSPAGTTKHNESDPSDGVTATTTAEDYEPSTVPTDLQATVVTADSVFLGWGASSDNQGVAGYRVFRYSVKYKGDSTSDYAISVQFAEGCVVQL